MNLVSTYTWCQFTPAFILVGLAALLLLSDALQPRISNRSFALIGALWGLVISAIYMLRAFRNIFEGSVGRASERATGLTRMDIAAAVFLAVFIVLFGICPPIWL